MTAGRRGTSFDDLVDQALDSLPEGIARAMQNVAIVVEDEPPAYVLEELDDDSVLFGFYHGVPLTERGDYNQVLPDKISIFRGPIERECDTPDEIREEVRRTVIHEIAHHFGIDEDRLDELGWA